MKHKLYTRLLSLALAVGLVIGMLPCAAAVDTVGDAGQPVTFADPDSPLKLNKTVTDNGNKTYTVNLEAYTTGTVTSTENAVPTDIVLVLDESGSMADNSYNFTPVYDLDTGEDYYVKTSNGYVRVSFCDGGLFNSHDDGWYTGIHFLWHWGTRYEPMTSAGDTGAGHVQFYQRTDNSQSRRDVLVEAAKQFANNIKDEADASNVDHRISIVHFADSSQIEIGLEADIRDNIDNVLLAIDRLGNNGGTYIEDGMANAETVFENAAPTTSQERNRVVVVFTDGIPGSGTWNNSTINNSANPAIKTSYTLKNTYGAKVYTLGMLENADPNLEISNEDNDGARTNKFLHYLSSNYPQAESMNNGGSGSNEGYYLSVQDSDSLNEVFEKIKDSIGAPDIELGTSAQVIDEVTQYFDLPSNASAITIQQADYNGSSFGAAYDAPDTVQARIEGQKVIVTGFDFDKNFVTDTAKEDGTYGKKLIISFTITPDPEFWGGNKVPTNVLATSGVTDSSGVLAGNFPDPGTQDVPLKDISLTGKNVNVYYGGATPDAAGLVNQIDFPTNWRTDYVKAITYSTNNTVSNTQDGSYTVTATLSPKYTGTYSDETATATANVDVFKPEITWQDSTNAYGTQLTNEFLAEHNAKTEWKHDTIDSSTVTMFGDAPSLTYEFTDETGAALDTLKKETNVKVTSVKSNNFVVPNVSFKWQAGAECADCTDPNPAYQFRIHMATSHTDEYPVRFYLEGVGSGAPNYPFIDDWAKLDAVFSGGFVAIPSANTCVYSDDLVVQNGAHQASDTITGNNAVAQWLTTNQAKPNLTVSDIKVALESLVELGNLSKDTVLETVGNTQYTVEDILASPEDFELRYTQVAENTDVIQEYYKGNRNGMYQQSYHVHLTVVRKPGDLTITKTFEGIDTPPTGFNIQVKDGNELIKTLTLENADSNENGVYTWTITDIPETTYTIIENGTDVTDMVLNATFDGAASSSGTTATVEVKGGEEKTVAITNTYTPANVTLTIKKNLTDFANNGKPVFSFKITDYTDGTVYYLHIDMTGKETDQDVLVGAIEVPAGHKYMVEELTNLNYKCTDSQSTPQMTITRAAIGKEEGTINEDTTVTFTNAPNDTRIPTDGGATENRVDKIKDGVIVWKKEVYGTDHPEPQPSPNPNDEE